jgi:thiamine biosynthesis lipoprotein
MDLIREHGASSGKAAPRMAREPFAAIELDPARGRVRLPRGMEIDLGGIAKGWIVQEAAQRLELYGLAAAVSAGGDMYFAGMRMDGSKWRVEIEDPRDPAGTAACLRVSEGAVVTSSVTKRHWTQGGQHRHHIIDPRTGEPAWPDWQSVTVVAAQAPLAEAYAKALLIGGEKASNVLLLQQPSVGFIGINKYGETTVSAKAKEFLHDCSERV